MMTFFHLDMSILNPSLIHKIEKGEFVELEKLLPKQNGRFDNENRLEWVQKDGGTILVPANRDNKDHRYMQMGNRLLELTQQFTVVQIRIGLRKIWQ